MLVEVVYDYQPLVSNSIFGPRTIRYESAFNVRQRTNQAITNTGSATPRNCTTYNRLTVEGRRSHPRLGAMSGPISVDLPHRLGAEEAKRRIGANIGSLAGHLPSGAQVRSSWQGDRLKLGIARDGPGGRRRRSTSRRASSASP